MLEKNLILTQEEVIENQIEWKLNRINLQNNCVVVNLVSVCVLFSFSSSKKKNKKIYEKKTAAIL